MLSAILFLELRQFLLRGPAVLAMGLVILSIGYAGWSGDRWRDDASLSLNKFVSEQMSDLQSWRTDQAAIETGQREDSPYAANPMSITLPATLPPGLLADFSRGHADLRPSSAQLSLWNNVSDLFGRYQFDNPEVLALGAFDVALVVIALMPLLMIAISFHVLASERAQGSLALTLCAPTSLSRLVWTKLLLRNGALWLCAALVMTVLATVNGDGADRYVRFVWWLVTCLIYALFWIALIAWVVSRVPHATQVAAILTASWFLLTTAVPGVVALVSDAAHPTPSRLALLSEVRRVEAATNRELAEITDQFLTDHPELTVGDEGMPSFYRAAFLSNEGAREVAAPVMQNFVEARTARARTLDWLQYLSPAIVVQRMLQTIAGSDSERQDRFQAQARDALYELYAALGPAVASRSRVSVSKFDQLTPFQYQEPPLRELTARYLLPILFILALAVLLIIATNRRLKNEELWT